MRVETNNADLIRKLSRQFGNYRAEWNGDDVFSHFTTPGYFASLEQFRPCVLQGGRGSGKTTTLKGLSYQGQYKIWHEDILAFDQKSQYIGLYRRIDTNHVRVFRGAGIEQEKWQKLFGHFFNLETILDVVLFLKWHKMRREDDVMLSESVMRHVCGMINCRLDRYADYDHVIAALRDEIYEFQCYVNNIASQDVKSPVLSTIRDPIEYLMSEACSLKQFKEKRFFILLDEYENFEDYQQAIINTLIKHSSEFYTFKIGVREQGWREKHTTRDEESLNDPADYSLLDINKYFEEEASFKEFAKDICQKRFLMALGADCQFDVEKSLCSLSNEEEAILLDVNHTDSMSKYNALPKELRGQIGDIPELYKFAIVQWAEMHRRSVESEALAVVAHRTAWNTRYNNYKYQMLFRIKTGRGRVGIQKYYCGFDTYVKLAANNIRYLMQLIYKTFEAHLNAHGILETVSPELQTKVARMIGEKNLAQLEGECREGSRIVRLLFGLGKIFGHLARKDCVAAELNQIAIEGLDSDMDMKSLLNAAVLHLALIRSPGDKLSKYETKEYEYNVHPIFAPFFVYSYRRKRKMSMSVKIVRGLSEDPKRYVKIFLGDHGKITEPQMLLEFELSGE